MKYIHSTEINDAMVEHYDENGCLGYTMRSGDISYHYDRNGMMTGTSVRTGDLSTYYGMDGTMGTGLSDASGTTWLQFDQSMGVSYEHGNMTDTFLNDL